MSLFNDPTDDFGDNAFGPSHYFIKPSRESCRHQPARPQNAKAVARRYEAAARKNTPIDDKKIAPRYNAASHKKQGSEIIDFLIAALRIKQRFDKKDPPSP